MTSPATQHTVAADDDDETKVFRDEDEDEPKTMDSDSDSDDKPGSADVEAMKMESNEVAKETEQMSQINPFAAQFVMAQAMANAIVQSPVFAHSPRFTPLLPFANPLLAAASPIFQGMQASPVFYNPQMPMIPFGQYPQHQFAQIQRTPLNASAQNTPRRQSRRNEERIKKPLNSFMLYMKCNRKKMLEENAEYRKMQSAELNKVMGENWQKLTPDERNVYEEMAKKEQENHKAKYPNWTARDNYAVHKRRQRRDRVEDNGNEAKKCRARFGVDNQEQWCKHCRRKKRCLNVYKSERDGSSPLVSSTTHHENILHLNQMNLHHQMNLQRQPTESPMSSRSEMSELSEMRSGTTTSSATGSLSHPGSIKSEAHDDSDDSDDEDISDAEGDATLTEPSGLGAPQPAQNPPPAQPPLAHPIPQMPPFPGHFPALGGFPGFPGFSFYPPPAMHQAPPQPQSADTPEYKNL